jgi:hypothetical protein
MKRLQEILNLIEELREDLHKHLNHLTQEHLELIIEIENELETLRKDF